MATDRAALLLTAQDVLRRGDGVAHLQRFLQAGLTREHVGHLRHLGVVVRARIGWYVSPDVPRSGVMAVGVGGVLGCAAAARSWGIVVPPRLDRLEVSIEPGTTRLRRSDDPTRRAFAATEPDVRWHWEERADPPLGWRVTPLDALLQLASCVEWRWLVAAIDSARCTAQREALLDDRALVRLRDLLPAHLKDAVDRSDARSETAGETFVRLAAEDAGLRFEPNVRMTDGYRVDGLVDGRLPIEIDGAATHAGRDAMEHDRARDATLAFWGAHTLRFSENEAVQRTAFVIETIRRVLDRTSTARSRGRRPLADPQKHDDTPRSSA